MNQLIDDSLCILFSHRHSSWNCAFTSAVTSYISLRMTTFLRNCGKWGVLVHIVGQLRTERPDNWPSFCGGGASLFFDDVYGTVLRASPLSVIFPALSPRR